QVVEKRNLAESRSRATRRRSLCYPVPWRGEASRTLSPPPPRGTAHGPAPRRGCRTSRCAPTSSTLSALPVLSIRDGEPAAAVRRLLDLVEQRDGVVLCGD